MFDLSPCPSAVLNAWLIVELPLCLFPVDGHFAIEVADEDNFSVSGCRWVCPRFDRRESRDPVRFFPPPVGLSALLTFSGPPLLRNIEDKDQE